MPANRVPIAAAALAALAFGLAAAGPAAAQDGAVPAASPRHELRGEWRFGDSSRYEFTGRSRSVSGRLRGARSISGCRLRSGTVYYRSFRFRRSDGSADVWEGLALRVNEECDRRYVASVITIASDLRFEEASRPDGGGRLRRTVHRRVRPEPAPDDPIVGTWTRNAAGVAVRHTADGYEGRAREAFVIPNGCTLPAGTLVWRLTPLAPKRYDGETIRFLAPPGCQPYEPADSVWRLSPAGTSLTRIADDGTQYPYAREP